MSAISLKSITGITSITTPAGVDNQLTLHTNNTTERLRITSDGNVGIGTDPDTRLHVYGSSQTGKLITLSGGVNKRNNYIGISQSDNLEIGADEDNQGGDSSIRFRIDGSEKLRIDSSGRLGLNMTSPQRRVHIHTTGSGSDYIQFTNDTTGTTSTSGYVFGISGEEDVIHNNFESTNIRFFTAGTERLRITSDGKIVIGEDNPDGNYLLIRAASTVGTNKGHIMLTGDSATNGQGPQIVFSESGSGSNFAGAYIGHSREGSNSTGNLVFATRATAGDANTVPTERVRITSDGRIGINDPSPNDYELDILKRSDADDAQIRLYNNATGSSNDTIMRFQIGGTSAGNYIYFGDSADTNVGMIRYAHSDDSLRFTVNADERLRIDSSGRVGVNQSSFATSDTMFSVSETTGHCEIGIISKNDSGAVINMGDTDSYNQGRIKYDNNDNSLTFRTSGSDRLLIASDGKVSLGTSPHANPAAALHIDNDTNNMLMLDNNTAQTQKIFFANNGSTHAQLYATSTQGSLIFESDPSDAHNDSLMNFTIDGSSKLRINNTGLIALDNSTAQICMRDSGVVDNAIFYIGGGTRTQTSTTTDFTQICLYDKNSQYNTQTANGSWKSKIKFFAAQMNGGAREGAFVGQDTTYNNFSGSTIKMRSDLIFGTRGDAQTSSSDPATEKLRIRHNGTILISEPSGTIGDGANLEFFYGNNNSTDVISSIIFSNNVGEVSRIQGETRNGNTNGMITFHTDVSGSSSERMRINHDGAFCFGNDSARPAEFNQPNGFSLRWDDKGQFQNTVTDTTGGLMNRKGSDGQILTFRRDGTGVGHIGVNASTMYLNFGGTTAADHQLDDYEEGTWTPTAHGYTGSNTSGNCFYTKIGRVVVATFRITWPSLTSNTSAEIRGLPFTCISQTVYTFGGAFSETNDNDNLSMIVVSNSNKMLILRCGSGGVDAQSISEVSGKDFRGTITYFTDS